MIARPQTTSFIGHDVANKIEAAIADYMMAEKANCLSEPFQVLHALPALLRGMAETSQSADRIAELEKQIVALVGETVRLSKDVEALRDAAKSSKGKSLGGVFIETSMKTTATILTGGFWGTVAKGISHFTGVVDFGSALEVISDFGTEIEEIAPTLPPVTEL